MIKNRCDFSSAINLGKDLRKNDLGTFLMPLLMMNYSVIVMIQKQKNNRISGCLKWYSSKESPAKQKFRYMRMVPIFFMQLSQPHWNLEHRLTPIVAPTTVSPRLLCYFKKTGACELILHDDNARPFRAWITAGFLTENRTKSYMNASYSPDLCSCDFYPFMKLKNQLRTDSF